MLWEPDGTVTFHADVRAAQEHLASDEEQAKWPERPHADSPDVGPRAQTSLELASVGDGEALEDVRARLYQMSANYQTAHRSLRKARARIDDLEANQHVWDQDWDKRASVIRRVVGASDHADSEEARKALIGFVHALRAGPPVRMIDGMGASEWRAEAKEAQAEARRLEATRKALEKLVAAVDAWDGEAGMDAYTEVKTAKAEAWAVLTWIEAGEEIDRRRNAAADNPDTEEED